MNSFNHYHKIIRIIILGVSISFIANGVKANQHTSVCYEPTCGRPHNVNRPRYTFTGKKIERTFLKKLTHEADKIAFQKLLKSSVDICNTPDLPVNITESDMATLFTEGSRRVSWLDTSLLVNIDIGVESNDTQFWTMPDFDLIAGFSMESIDPDDSPYQDSFPGTNMVYKGLPPGASDTLFFHYELKTDEFSRHGVGVEFENDTFALDWFDTEAFLPINCEFNIEDTVVTVWQGNDDIDSIVEAKFFYPYSTGMLTPVNEDPVPAILGYLEFDYKEYDAGVVVESFDYEAFVWFSEKGHRITAYLADGAPYSGVTQFQWIEYETNIPACPPTQDFGIDMVAGDYRAQNSIKLGGGISNGPIQFVAADSVILKAGFSIDTTFNVLMDADPCGVSL